MSRCAVTGATGYVGSVLAADLSAEGHSILELGRRGSGSYGRSHAFFDLREPVEPATLRGVDVLVHCAHDFGPRSPAEVRSVNVDGARSLFRAADAASVPRIVLVSTLSAFPGCRSRYGQAKLELEAEVLSRGGAVVRPGLVWGGDSMGMVGALERAVTRLPVVPLVGGGAQRLHLCHEEDLARLVRRVSTGHGPFPVPIVAASERARTFREILEIVASARGRRVRFLPVPYQAAWLGLMLLEKAGVRPRFSSDSLVSLAHLVPEPDFTATREVGQSFRDFGPALTRPGST